MTDRLTERLRDYRDHASAAFPVTDLTELESGRWRRRRRQRRTLIAAAAATAALLAGVVVALPRPESRPPAPVATSIFTVDWADTELIVPPNPDQRCPEGRVRLYPRVVDRVGRIGMSDPGPEGVGTTLQTAGEAAYGDLTRDGRPEAVLPIRCSLVPGGMSDQSDRQLLVVQMRPDHTLHGLQFIGTVSASYPSFQVADGLLYVQMRYNHASAGSAGSNFWDTAFTQVFRWNGTSFDRIAGRTDPLNFTGAHNGYGVPSQLADILDATGSVLCPAALVPFAYAPYTVDGYTYDLDLTAGRHGGAQKVDVDADGNEELVVGIRCTGPGYDAVSIYLLRQGSDRFLTMDVLANDGTWVPRSFDATSTRLSLTADGLGETTLTWTGQRFEPPVGAYRLVP